MAPLPEQNENPQVTTEPQRQALDEMSHDLLRKLNAMVEEQNERARQFANTEHSLSSTPMEFNITLPESPGISTASLIPAQQAATIPGTSSAAPVATGTCSTWGETDDGTASTPPPPPSPLLPGNKATQDPAAQRRAQILQRQREQRKAEQEAEEQRRERIRQAQESADSVGSLLEFLGLKKSKSASADADLPPPPSPGSPSPAPGSPAPASQPASGQSCGCTTLFVVIAVILIILKVIASMD